MKLQIATAYLLCLTAVLCQRKRALPFTAALSAYLALITPFVMRSSQRDVMVAAAAPALLFCRDLALGAGFVTGLLEVLAGVAKSRSTTSCAS